ncbi:unnamed protein product [Didymodactylos carnosus]|uniref:Cilia- and flagella-associated protein 77-like n=1 Tax=Didymodactylos carnosus TaxID=1234261 RepID=A0A813UC33_9BILA|nr:unnamed protein product [Didymodactylos carnosus]CAF0824625.1 unnamed protein product [Didymodactylos carnosus]CAF3561137.1 unnamed protein product [Didymodactylos carnosus]CAF3611297.1 unnamed protein product [Didymodactylos carnosus]
MNVERSNSFDEKSSSASPYEFTKTGMIGEQRDTMLSSPLQIVPELGKSSKRGHKLPAQNFTYGITIPRRDGGVAEAMYHGSSLEKTGSAINPDFEYVRDYSALNKAALEAGMISAKDQSRFRYVVMNPMRFPDDVVFGTPCRPSTPISEVLEYKFSEKWTQSMREKELNSQKQRADVANAFKGSYHTKASLLRQAKIPVEPKQLWQLSKFANGEAQIDSFRDENERRKAHSATMYDSLARQGTFHTGIYNVPRTTVKT